MAEPSPPLIQERDEFGRNLEQVRDRSLRIISRIRPEPEADTCIFFVHGGGGRACQFKNQIRSFQEMYDVVGIDFLGHGDSPAPNDPSMYTADEHLKDLVEVFMKYKKGRNYIVAHCYGALHTLRLLKHLSSEDLLSTITGLVLISIGYKCPVPGTFLLNMPATILEWLRPLARAKSNATLFTPETDPSLIAFENSISDNNRMYFMKVIGKDCSDSDRWEMWFQEAKDVIISQKLPVAIVAGEMDGVYPPDTCKQLSILFELPDDCFHVVNRVGHMAMLEKPDIVKGIIRQLIEKTEQT